MKIMSVEKARSVWLMRMVDANPRGLYGISIITAIAERYKFLKLPPKEQVEAGNEFKFSRGVFVKDDQTQLGVELSIYNDGLVADTRSSTDDSDAFIDDLLTYLSETFNITPYEQILSRRIYFNELWVKCDKKLHILNPKLKKFEKEIGELSHSDDSNKREFETAGLIFSVDPTIPAAPGAFRFERAANTPFTENRYFTAAPLTTKNHIELLEKFEKLLS